MLRRSALLLAVIGCVTAAGIAGCGSTKGNSSSIARAATATTATHLAKTKFVLHAALAFGAFHHFIYDPATAGDFKHPFSHKLTIVKAGLATVFVYHELKLTATDVKSSKILSTLFSPLIIVADKVKGLDSQIKSGNASQIDGVNSSLASIKSTAASNGQGFSDQVPSSAELAAGGTS